MRVLLYQGRVTDCAEIFRYMDEGVRNSEDMEAHNGTRLGGLGKLADFDKISRTSCSDGCIPIWNMSVGYF